VKMLPDSAARSRATSDLDHNLVVDAGAGTGKTTVLIDRIVQLVATGRTELRRITAITFTEKAAGELKLRLRNVLEERLATGGDTEERLRTALEQLDRRAATRAPGRGRGRPRLRRARSARRVRVAPSGLGPMVCR